MEAIINPWLDRVRQELGVELFNDIEGRCKQVAELLGKIGTVIREEV